MGAVMQTSREMMHLPTNELQLDVENPRINQILDQHGGTPPPEAISLALGDIRGSFVSLREAIKTSGTIISPILVNKDSEKGTQVIDGNTPLSIYKSSSSLVDGRCL
jgi:hypothetical protein